MEFFTHLISVVFTAIIIVGVLALIDSIRRKFHKGSRYRITCEYKLFIYSLRNRNEAIEELNKLGKDGWETGSFAGHDILATYLILKRETLHIS